MLKKITIILFILLLSCVSNNKYPWFLESFDIAKSVAGSRLIMLDFCNKRSILCGNSAMCLLVDVTDKVGNKIIVAI